MEQLLQQIDNYKTEINGTIANTKDELEAFRIKYLGTKGLVKTIMGEMKNVAAENKKQAGQLLNEFKIFVEDKFDELKNASENGAASIKAQELDLSLPGTADNMGTRHPISIIQNKIVSIFNRLGFSVAEGPEIEDDWHNFTALNMPENHTARDMQDTFYILKNPDWILRTHTSSVQIREMEKGKLPLRIICPGGFTETKPLALEPIAFLTRLKDCI